MPDNHRDKMVIKGMNQKILFQDKALKKKDNLIEQL